MRCLACDNELTDEEATIKDDSGNFIDMCFECGRKTTLAENQDWSNDHLRVGCRDESGSRSHMDD